MSRPLLPAHRAALAKLVESGKPLIRVPGGIWTYEGCERKAQVPGLSTKSHDKVKAPGWSIPTQTVQALERAGYLQRARTKPDDWDDPRVLTEAGRSLGEAHILLEKSAPFREHLEACEHCDKNRHNLCPVGKGILNSIAPPMPPGPNYEAARAYLASMASTKGGQGR